MRAERSSHQGLTLLQGSGMALLGYERGEGRGEKGEGRGERGDWRQKTGFRERQII